MGTVTSVTENGEYEVTSPATENLKSRNRDINCDKQDLYSSEKRACPQKALALACAADQYEPLTFLLLVHT
jgi:hypothetical protein